MTRFALLIGLKWRVFLRTAKGPEAWTGRIVLWLFGATAFLMALAGAIVLFIGLYRATLSTPQRLAHFPLPVGLVLVLGSIYLTWIIATFLPTRSGRVFEPAGLLHYPISLRRLFMLDLLSEPFNGLPALLLPSLAALSLAPAVAIGRPWLAVLPLAVMVVFGTLMARLLDTIITLLNRYGRHVGEGVVTAANAVVLILILTAISAAPRLQELILHPSGWAGALIRATPLVLGANMIASLATEDMADHLFNLAALGAYLPPLALLCYSLWRRLALGDYGNLSRAKGHPSEKRPWNVTGLAGPQSALLEKEMKYLLRNPQLRLLLILPLMFLLIKFGFVTRNSQAKNYPDWFAHVNMLYSTVWAPYLDGILSIAALSYLMLLYGTLINNLFGIDGHGARFFPLAPISARTVLLMKNLAVILVIAAQAAIVLLLDQLVFQDVSLEAISVGLAAFLSAGPLLLGCGNIISVRFPHHSPYGKRLEASPAGVVLMFLEVPMAMLPVLSAFVLGIMTQSLMVKHIMLAASVIGAIALYVLCLLPVAARSLEAGWPHVADRVANSN